MASAVGAVPTALPRAAERKMQHAALRQLISLCTLSLECDLVITPIARAALSAAPRPFSWRLQRGLLYALHASNASLRAGYTVDLLLDVKLVQYSCISLIERVLD